MVRYKATSQHHLFLFYRHSSAINPLFTPQYTWQWMIRIKDPSKIIPEISPDLRIHKHKQRERTHKHKQRKTYIDSKIKETKGRKSISFQFRPDP